MNRPMTKGMEEHVEKQAVALKERLAKRGLDPNRVWYRGAPITDLDRDT